jgi:hypothetical protein
MDGKGRWMDNVFIERLWKSVKYEDIYLKAYGSMAEVKKGLATYFTFYNEKRWHQNLEMKIISMNSSDSSDSSATKTSPSIAVLLADVDGTVVTKDKVITAKRC